MSINCRYNEKFVLKNNSFANFLKLIALIAFVFFIAKMRFEIGGSWLVDSLFIFACILLAFLFSVSAEVSIIIDDRYVKVKLVKNLLGVKLVSIYEENTVLYRKLTTGRSINANQVFDDNALMISDMNQSKVEVRLLEKIPKDSV